MKIIHIMHKFKIGGVESAVLSAYKFAPKSINFKIAVVDKSIPPIYSEDDFMINEYNKFNPYGYFKMAVKISKQNPDFIITSLWRSFLVGTFVKILNPKIHWIIFFHNTKFNHILDKIISIIGLRICDSVFVDSEETKKFIKKYIGKTKIIYKISFILDKIKPCKKKNLKNDNLINFIFWGRITKQKRIDKVLKLLFLLKNKYKYKVKFTIIGPDEGEKSNLINIAKKLNLSSDITFLEALEFSEIRKLACTSDFYIQLSDYEGMAMSVVESMQLGLVPIVTPVGEIKRYVHHKKNGILFNDFEESLIDILKVHENKNLYLKLSESATKTFSTCKVYYEDFFEKIELIRSQK